MFARSKLALVGLAAALVALLLAGVARSAPAPRPAKPTPEEIAVAKKAVEGHLATLKGEGANVQLIASDPLFKTLPAAQFFSVLFRQYPVARLAPEGLSSSNVFAVGADGKITVMTDAKSLEKYFRAHGDAAKTEAAQKDAARAWLQLSQQFHQDGFYEFELMDDSTKVSEKKGEAVAQAKVVAMRGGNGDIEAALTFDSAGKLFKVEETAKLRPGPRPRCHATKLLDADAIVRRIAEDDLLFMGRAAKDYLDEQRAKASPELRAAIDRVWQRICAEQR